MLGSSTSGLSIDSNGGRREDRPDRLIMVSNQLPVRMKRQEGVGKPAAGQHGWVFEWDEDSLVGQAKAGIEQPQFQTIQARRGALRAPPGCWVRVCAAPRPRERTVSPQTVCVPAFCRLPPEARQPARCVLMTREH